MSADFYFTMLSLFLSSFFLLFFVSYSRSSLNGTQPYPAGHMVGSKRNLKMHVRNLGYPFPLQIGGPKTTFWARLRNSTATLTAYILGIKHGIHKWVSALQTTRGLLYRLKTTWTLVQKRLQIRSEFSPTLRKFCIPLQCQASQTEISKRNSTKLCQTVDGRPR